jgi:hypothetical protein
MIHSAALLQASHDACFFIQPVWRKQLADRLADHFFGPITEDSFRPCSSL